MPNNKVIKSNAQTALREKWPQSVGISAIFLAVLSIHFVLLSMISALLSGFVGETTAAFVGLFAVVLVGQFFGMPFLCGALRWFWFTSLDADVPLNEIFCYFSRGGEYLRILSLSFRLLFRMIGIAILCFLPAFFVQIVRLPLTYEVLNSSMPYWTASMWALGKILTVCGTLFSLLLLSRYMAAPILMINDPVLSPQEALNLSMVISKSSGVHTLSFFVSFLLCGLLSLLILPLLFTLPYFLCSYSIFYRFSINRYNRSVQINDDTYTDYQNRL